MPTFGLLCNTSLLCKNCCGNFWAFLATLGLLFTPTSGHTGNRAMSLRMFIKGKQIAKEKIKKVVKLGFQFFKKTRNMDYLIVIFRNNHFLWAKKVGVRYLLWSKCFDDKKNAFCFHINWQCCMQYCLSKQISNRHFG